MKMSRLPTDTLPPRSGRSETPGTPSSFPGLRRRPAHVRVTLSGPGSTESLSVTETVVTGHVGVCREKRVSPTDEGSTVPLL